jgi:hypothetical protein
MTYLWQEERGKNFYRVQTDEKLIANKLKRRKGFNLSVFSVNDNLWIFSCLFSRPDIAKKVLKNVTGKDARIDSDGVVLYD